MKTKTITLISSLTALSLVIFIVEAQIPPIVPIPGIKLGLANIVSLIAVFWVGKRNAFLIVILRIFLGSIYAGNAQTFLFSLSGGLLCCFVTIGLSVILKDNKIWVISIIGAISHIIGQLAVAYLLTNIDQIFYYAPILILSAIITGSFTGIVAQITYKRIKNINLY